MNVTKNSHSFFSPETITYLVLTVCSVVVLAAFVNLVPHVDEDFFFSSGDPQFRQEKRISRIFKRKDSQLLISAQGQITSPAYIEHIKNLSRQIATVNGVVSVVSVTQGPRDIQDALASPFWNRLLIADNKKATNVIVILETAKKDAAVSSIERLAVEARAPDFTPLLSGMPYIVKLIQRQLGHDIRTFSLLAFFMFSCVMMLIFRSWRVLAGTLVCCLNAAIWTLMIAHLCRISIGVLTANLATVVFVLTLSPIIFLTHNWSHLPRLEPDTDPVAQTIRHTFIPSLWSASTQLLGFLSLLTVPAKPLRELGLSGAIGVIVALGTAYIIYPSFLRTATPPAGRYGFVEDLQRAVFARLNGKKSLIALCLVLLGFLALPGFRMIDKDPSLFSYFKKDSDIARGLAYIDHNGGSNPLIIVVRGKDGEKFNTHAAYKRLWDLQNNLERHEAVGTVLSLPVLMAQAKRPALAFFLSWEWLLQILESPQYGEISKSFVSPDRQRGVFLLRMKEYNRRQTRLEIVGELKKIVEKKGFVPEIVGGTYVLQGHMSRQVVSSLVGGVTNLMLAFFIIGVLASRSFKLGFAMTLSFSVLPLVVLGAVGFLKIPLDVVSAPAVNVAIGMGIDSALYMVRYWRWIRRPTAAVSEDWEEAKKYMWHPVVNAMTVIMLGFGIFLFSQFPPTQRFGASIVLGGFLSIFASIFLMPWLAQWRLPWQCSCHLRREEKSQ